MSETSLPRPLTIDALHGVYRRGETTPPAVIESILDRIGDDEDNVWITTRSERALRERATEVATLIDGGFDGEAYPLLGIPFAVKDNIDAAGLPTTAGCEAFAYEPDADATVVERLREAGAVLIGKTNMDQFATGLVGTRTPYGEPRNPFDPDYITGGSSSGSAVAVASHLVPFALGTDTAGSGRVPAAFNNVVGLKPTRGVLSTAGVVPACRTLDCVAVFALSCGDALRVERVAAGYDPADPYSRREADDLPLDPVSVPNSLTFGVPDEHGREFFGDDEAAECFEAAVSRLESIGWRAQTIDFTPFREAADLLYDGPWVAERLAALREFFAEYPDAPLDVTKRIIERGAEYSAVDTFEAFYELKRLERRARAILDSVDFAVTPTAGTIYTREAIAAAPVESNSNLGYYTNFVNLLDLAAVAVPAGFRPSGLPFGVTLLGDTFDDALLSSIGREFVGARMLGVGGW